MNEFSLPVRVYIEDTDAGGIVYYVNYLKFMERARTEFLRSLGFDKAGGGGEQMQFVVHSAEIEYKRPARLDDLLQSSARVVSVRGASILFEQQITRDAELLCRAKIKVASVAVGNLRPIPLPAEMLEKIDRV